MLARSDLAASAAAWLEVLVRRDPATKTPAVAALRRVASSVPEADARYARDVLLRLGVALTPAARPPAGKVSIPRTAGTEWAGFQEHEFGKNDGTKWRSATGRASLAPIVLRRLQALDPDFISFGVDRSPEIHFAVGRRYRANPLTVSKLFVYAHGPTDEDTETPLQAAAGWYIERGDGEAKHGDPDDATTWDWPLFLRALERPEFQQRLSRLMEKHGLRLGDYEGSRYTKALGWSAVIEDGDPVARAGKQVARGWADVLGAAAGRPADRVGRPPPRQDVARQRGDRGRTAVRAGRAHAGPARPRTALPGDARSGGADHRVTVTLGIDLASADATTAACAIEWANGSAAIVDLRPSGVQDKDILRLAARAHVAGIDAPFGWPIPFAEALGAYARGEPWPRAKDDELWFRATDVHAKVKSGGRPPLSVSSDRIARPAVRAALLLTLLGKKGKAVARDGTDRVIEVYPAGAMRSWHLGMHGYKRPNAVDLRRVLATELLEGAGVTASGSQVIDLAATDHALDAFVAALVARAFALGKVLPPPAELADVARVEGWLFLPSGSLADLRA